MNIETDLKKIEEKGKEKYDENWKFRSFLKMCPDDRIDRIVHRIYRDILTEIDCKKCGNCCRRLTPLLDDSDIKKISEFLKTSTEEFKKKYLDKDKEEKRKYHFRAKPCPFLENNICSIHSVAPEDCRSFPHLHKDGFIARTMGIVDNYSVCPVVFNVFERLKTEVWYRDFPFEDDSFDEDI